MGALIPIEQQFTKAFNDANGTNYQFSDFVISELITIGSGFPADFQAFNTEITLLTEDHGISIAYNRVSLANYVGLPEGYKLALPKDADGTLSQLIPYLAKTTGIDFTARDFEEGQYVISDTLASLTFTTAKTSLRWLPGQTITFTLAGRYRITDAGVELKPITLAAQPDQYYEEHTRTTTNTGSRVLPVLTTSNTDYTPVGHLLRAIGCVSVGWSEDNRLFKRTFGLLSQLMAGIRSVDGLPWNFGGTATPFNLYNAYPIFNGPTKYAKGFCVHSGYTPSQAVGHGIPLDLVDTNYDNVLVARLDERYCSGLQNCHVVFHYNNSLKKGRVV